MERVYSVHPVTSQYVNLFIAGNFPLIHNLRQFMKASGFVIKDAAAYRSTLLRTR